jgi:CBS domain-containing protein
LAQDVASGEGGALVRLGANGILALVRSDSVGALTAALGVAESPFRVDAGDPDVQGTARMVLFMVTPKRVSSLRDSFVPGFRRFLKTEEGMPRLLAAESPGHVRELRRMMELDVREHLLVEDSLEPLQYRIYPETPVREAAELMVRRELHAVPVVGEDLGVLGIISVGDALENLLPTTGPEGERGEGGEVPDELTARDIMTRTVLCVSEDESLLTAGKLMVNRDVEQLPVVREGELIGFVTRAAILKRIVDLLPEGH